MNSYYDSLTHLHKIPGCSDEDLDSMLVRVNVEIANLDSEAIGSSTLKVRCYQFKKAVEDEQANRILLEVDNE